MINFFSYSLRFWLFHLVLPLFLAIFMIFIYPHTNIDAWLISSYYDVDLARFPLKRDWFIETVMHLWFKYLVIAISLVFLGLFVGSFLKKTPSWLKKYRRAFVWTFVTMVLSTTLISILKHMSNHSCPWDLIIYGGQQPFLELFEALPAGAKEGHCFPGGHASAGFSLMAIYFGFRDSQRKLANTALCTGLILGLVMGWGQMMRGAHFMSHNIWTGLIVWMFLLTLYLLWSPRVKN